MISSEMIKVLNAKFSSPSSGDKLLAEHKDVMRKAVAKSFSSPSSGDKLLATLENMDTSASWFPVLVSF